MRRIFRHKWDNWVKHVSKEATFAADYVNALVVIARRRKA